MTYLPLRDLSPADGLAVRGRVTPHMGRLYWLAGECGPNGAPSCNGTGSWNTDVHRRQCPGALVSMLPDGSDFRVGHAFGRLDESYHNEDGYHPYGSLTPDYDGLLWGVTQGGGNYGRGTLFSYHPAGGFTTEWHFGVEGKSPTGSVAVHPNGGVYGIAKGHTDAGDSVVLWRYDRDLGKVTHTPPSRDYGWSGYGGLTYTPVGLVGMTYGGSANGRGASFLVDPDTLGVAAVAPFDGFAPSRWGQDNMPIGAPTLLSNGSTVAVREFGGTHGTGLVIGSSGLYYEFDPISDSTTPRFANATGAMPNGAIAEGPDGLLYGSTLYGGEGGEGVIFRVARNGALFGVVHHFPAGGPSRVYGGLSMGPDGALYGVTWSRGQVFRYEPPTRC